MADEGGAGAVDDLDVDILARAVAAAGENAHLAVGGAAAQVVGVPLGRAFDEDSKTLSDVFPVALEGLPVLQVDDLVQPARLHFRRDVVGIVPGGEGAGALRVREHESPVEADFLHEAHRRGMVLLRLGAETGDDIGREAAVGHHAADLGDPLQVPFAVIFPPHLLQHPGAAGLHGKMDVLADIVVRGHRFDDFVADVFRMGSGETDSQFGADGRDAPEQFREVHGFIRGLPQVAVHVLAQQRHFLVPFLEYVAGFAHDGMRVARAFRATGVRHHAIGADVVAAAHDGNEGAHAILVCPDRGDVRIGFVAGEEHVDLGLVRRDGPQQPRQRPVSVRSHDQVHLPRVQQLVFQALRHAPHDAHDQARAPLALQVELLDPAPDPLFRIVADGTRVRHDEIGLLHRLRPLIPFSRQDGKDHLRVVHVHLATVCLDIGFLHGNTKIIIFANGLAPLERKSVQKGPIYTDFSQNGE